MDLFNYEKGKSKLIGNVFANVTTKTSKTNGGNQQNNFEKIFMFHDQYSILLFSCQQRVINEFNYDKTIKIDYSTKQLKEITVKRINKWHELIILFWV